MTLSAEWYFRVCFPVFPLALSFPRSARPSAFPALPRQLFRTVSSPRWKYAVYLNYRVAGRSIALLMADFAPN